MKVVVKADNDEDMQQIRHDATDIGLTIVDLKASDMRLPQAKERKEDENRTDSTAMLALFGEKRQLDAVCGLLKLV